MAHDRRLFLRRAGGGALLALVPIVAGCGSDDGRTTPAEPGGQSGQAAYPDYEWSQLEGATPVSTTQVTLQNGTFEPLIAQVSPGTTVTFTNEDTITHTVTIPRHGVDQSVPGGERTTVTFESAGTYDYVCTIHSPSMLGRVVVGEGSMADDSGAESTTATPTETEGSGLY